MVEFGICIERSSTEFPDKLDVAYKKESPKMPSSEIENVVSGVGLEMGKNLFVIQVEMP